MAKLNIKNPSGFPELSPAQERVRQQWLSVINEVFAKYGFQPIETPLVEREENLLAKGGNAKEMYVLKRLHDEEGDTSHSGNAFRFDHTVPLALYVARHMNDLTFPFKRSAIGPVLRGERAQKFRYRQFDQCDIDIIGSGSLSVKNDAVCIAVMIEIFERLNIGDFVVRINNRKVLLGYFESMGFDSKKGQEFLNVTDDLDKIGRDKVIENLISSGMSDSQVERFITFLTIVGDNDDLLKRMSGYRDNELFQEGVEELKLIVEALRNMGISENHFEIDPFIARGLDYYTGTVFETNLVGEGAVEGMSLCSGGRYDDLGETFTGRSLPGVGASIGLTRLLHMLFDAGILETENKSHIDLLVLPYASAEVGACIAFAQELRKQGKKVDVYLEDKKMGKKFDYADKVGVKWVAIIGEDELADGKVQKVQLKNMKTGESQVVEKTQILSLL